MGLWYSIGVALGIGIALGTAIAGAFAPVRGALLLASLIAAACGYVLAFAVIDLHFLPAASGAIGGLVGGPVTVELCRRTLARGGTKVATAILLVIAGALIAALALIPVAGYVEALLVIVFGLLQRRRGGDRYAGLRTLARD